jgi:8-oxo-dGTP diphosphatase
MRFEDIDWDNWTPSERATLLFVIRKGRLLLIHKKRGLGAGKINGPGGRIDDKETPVECAIREVQEELMVTPTGVRQAGELRFQFVDGFSIHGYVFTASDCDGEPQETDEATPLWTQTNSIPYEQMWADDRYWMPLMLEGTYFEGRFLFDGDSLLAHDVTTPEPPAG